MSQPETPKDKPINPAPPIGGVAPQTKEELQAGDDMPGAEHGQKTKDAVQQGHVVPEGEYREKVDGLVDNNPTDLEKSISVNSTMRPHERQDTPWPEPEPPHPKVLALITQLTSIQQQLADKVNKLSIPAPASTPPPAPAPERPSIFKRPNKLVCPTLSRFTTDPFVITRHLYALEAYLQSARPMMEAVGQWFTWSHEVGRHAVTFPGWSKRFKEKVLAPDWVRQAKNALKFMRMEGTTSQHFNNSTDPLADSDVKRLLMEGLCSHMLVLDVVEALEQKDLSSRTIPVTNLIDLMSKRVTVCSARLAAVHASRPPPHPAPAQAPRPAQARSAPTPIKAISTVSAPAPATAAEAQSWLDNTIRLPSGPDAQRAREFLRQRGLCFRCRQHGHMSQSYPTFQPQVAALSPVTPQAPAQSLASAPTGSLSESVPLLHVQACLSADGPSYQLLVDSGAAVNVVDKGLVKALGLETEGMLP
ncbi:hypothetical protein I350_07356 [Cryptococcus amylolentus CBS 6273]|uniref:Uncharacterized protein n=1 Tax=Cryptococcus amylolentus CBS 6273 TaxID=1296118 RepID=A0A1E3JEC8_9TREE|nr:hypothetical protein I350_07356 [Cryptococcus amylolentus CBS 6273]